VEILGSYFTKLSALIFKDKIKPLAIAQLMLFIPIIIISFFIFKAGSVNFYYNGLLQIIFSAYWLLLGIEQFIFKKKKFSYVYFFFSIMFILLAIQSFNLMSLKR
jgi:hypothetical protein